ncbi:MAG: hypothetical protein U0T69_12815 [Chitinophagales bacterium]
MIEKLKNDKEIAHHIFSGSTTMIGVCITVISLFRIMQINKQTLVDEILGADILLFIFSCFFSYLSLRNAALKSIENIADIIFFTGLLLLLVVGFIIVFTTY